MSLFKSGLILIEKKWIMHKFLAEDAKT